MRKIEKLKIEYVGYSEPETIDEVDLEILGLEVALCSIKHRISTLKQGVQLSKLMKESVVKDENIKPSDTIPDKQKG